MQVSDPQEVTPQRYQACVHYTLLAKLAPSWNQAGTFLIQGRDFLTTFGRVNAIKLELNINAEQLCFALKPCCLSNMPVKVSARLASREEMLACLTSFVFVTLYADTYVTISSTHKSTLAALAR